MRSIAVAILSVSLNLTSEARQITAADEARVQSALEAYNSGRTQEAENALRELAAHHPDRFEVVETLGLILAERGEVEQAIPWLEAGNTINPALSEAGANLGVAYLKVNRIDEAVRVLSRAVSLNPENTETQSSYGRALLLAKRPQAAAKAFRAASEAHPEDADALYNWALAEFEGGDVRQSAAVLLRIPAGSRSAQVDSLCGDAEEKLGHFDSALACFQSAAKLEPSEANLNALGLELLKHWSFDAASKVYEYALPKYSSSVRLRTGLGIAYYANGRYDQSAQIFSGLLTSAPTRADYARLLGESCVAVKAETPDSCEALVAYAKEHRLDAEAAWLAAATILARHDAALFPLAGELLQNAIAANPASADGYYQAGVLDQEQDKWSDSLTPLKRADRLRPKSSKTHLRLAVAYSHLGQKEQAHQEAALQKQFRQSEDAEMDAKRRELTTFVLEMR